MRFAFLRATNLYVCVPGVSRTTPISVSEEYLADNTVHNGKKLGHLPVFLYVPLRFRVAAGLVAMRLKLEFLGFPWNFFETIGKIGICWIPR